MSSPLQGSIHLRLTCLMENSIEERGFLVRSLTNLILLILRNLLIFGMYISIHVHVYTAHPKGFYLDLWHFINVLHLLLIIIVTFDTTNIILVICYGTSFCPLLLPVSNPLSQTLFTTFCHSRAGLDQNEHKVGLLVMTASSWHYII